MKNIIIFIFSIYLSLNQVSANNLESDPDTFLNDEEYYKIGVDHYNKGNFKKSFIVFFNLSEKGNKDAIFNVSNMYFQGIGTIQDYRKSLKYRKIKNND